VRLAEREQEAVEPAVVAAQRADAVDGEGQHRVRARLDEDADPVLGQRFGRLAEADPLAQAPVPVLGAHLGGVDQLGLRGREERDLGALRLDRGELAQEPLLDRLDLLGVRGVVDRDPPGTHVLALALLRQLVERLGLAGDDGRVRAVERGDGDAGAEALDPLADRRGVERDRHHPAVAG
jgi:hypothetical protein